MTKEIVDDIVRFTTGLAAALNERLEEELEFPLILVSVSHEGSVHALRWRVPADEPVRLAEHVVNGTVTLPVHVFVVDGTGRTVGTTIARDGSVGMNG